MSVNCAGCGGNITDSQYYMECSKCKHTYDLLCINVTTEHFDAFSDEYKSEWLCPFCVCSRPKGDNNTTPVRAQTVSVPLKTSYKPCSNINMSRGSKPMGTKAIITRGDSEMSTLITELRVLKQELAEVKQQNLEIKNQMTLISTTLDHNLVECNKKLQVAEQEIIFLKQTVGNLQKQVLAREQDGLSHDLEITGLTELAHENLAHIAMVISKKIGIELSEVEIDDVKRVGPKTQKLSINKKFPRPIVLKLLRKRKRDELINAAKSRRNLTSENIVEGEPTKIYLNERLTKENRHLFRLSRSRSNEYSFRYCWIKNGGIYVRKADGSPAIRISTTSDLDEKIGPANFSEN